MTLEIYPLGCFGCGGACCQRQTNGVPPWSAYEWSRLDEIVGHEIATQHRALHGHGEPTRCLMLTDDGLCGIHDHKPDECRVFRRGSGECLRVRREAGLPV